MTKRLLFGLATLFVAANLAMASAPAHLIKTGQSRVTAQKTVVADDTQILFEEFEDINTTTMMPEGWVTFDAITYIKCGNILEESEGLYQAFDGNNALYSWYDEENPRDAWAISSAVTLEAGVTYHMGVYALCMGYYDADEWTMTIGTAQTPEAQTNIIIDCSGANSKKDTEWTFYSGTFTPQTSGTYYLGIHHCTTTTGGFICLWDDIQIDSDHLRFKPEGSLASKGGLWSIDHFMRDADGYKLVPRVYTFEGEKFEYSYNATHCESVLWDFGFYGNTADFEAEKPIVTFSLDEDDPHIFNEDLLILMNEDCETAILREYYITRVHASEPYGDCVGNFKPEDNAYTLSTSNSTPNEALIGLNESYNRIAERFNRPDNYKTLVAGSYLLYGNYKFSPVNAGKKITARILSVDANGMPGDVVYSKEFKIKDVFGTSEVPSGYLSLGALVFEEEVEVIGSFFFEIEFPEVTPSSNNRLFLAHSYNRTNGDCTTYIYNNIDLASKPAGWYTAADYCDMNICCGIYPNVYFNDNTAVKTPSVASYTVFANGSELNIVNARENADIVVTDIAGRVVFTAQAQAIKTTIETNLNEGIYIVTIDGISTKVAIR